MSLDPSTMYDIEEFHKADARAGAEMLENAKQNFDDPTARHFLEEAIASPHSLTELQELAAQLYWDIEQFYSSDLKVGTAMLNMAREYFKKSAVASKFLGKAAAKPHLHPDLKKKAASLFWETQENFFHSLIRNYPKKDYEDLMMAMAEGFLKWLPQYDADNYRPGTFFKTRVLHYAYEEVIKINELIPEHKIHIKRMLRMQKEALIAEGKAVTAEALLATFPEDRRKDIDINDVKELLPFLGDDGHSMSLDTLGDGGVISEHMERSIKTPEENALARDKQEQYQKALIESFSVRELRILVIYSESGEKISETKKRLTAEGFTDITEDEIRRVWRDAANRIHLYTMKHPESKTYFGGFLKMYSRNSNHVGSFANTEDQSDEVHNLWDITVQTALPLESMM